MGDLELYLLSGVLEFFRLGTGEREFFLWEKGDLDRLWGDRDIYRLCGGDLE